MRSCMMSTFHRAPGHMNGQVNHHNYWIWEAEKHEIPVCMTLWKWTHGVDFPKWLCCRTCPFLQKTPLWETSVSACWNCLLSCKSAFSRKNTTSLNVLHSDSWAYTHMHISRRPTSELCDLMNISKQATWSCDSKYVILNHKTREFFFNDPI